MPIGARGAHGKDQGVEASAMEGSNPINIPTQNDLQMLKDLVSRQATSFADGWLKDGVGGVAGSSGDGKRHSYHEVEDDAPAPAKQKRKMSSKLPGTRQSFISR